MYKICGSTVLPRMHLGKEHSQKNVFHSISLESVWPRLEQDCCTANCLVCVAWLELLLRGHSSFDLLTDPDLVRSGRTGGFIHPIFKEALVGCSKELGYWLQLQVNETIATCCGMQQLTGYIKNHSVSVEGGKNLQYLILKNSYSFG